MKSLILALTPFTLFAAESIGTSRLTDESDSLGGDIETQRDFHLNLAPAWLHSGDFGEATAALQFELSYSFADAGHWPSESFDLEFAANGTLAWDASMNRDPIRTRIDYYYLAMPEFKKAITDWNHPLEAGEPYQSNPFSIELGLSAGYETDQSLEHRDGVASAYVRFIQPRGNDWHGLLPSVIASFDGVFTDANETADHADIGQDCYGRVRLVADWEFRASLLTAMDWLRPLKFHTAAEYSKDFGTSRDWENKGLDESFNVFAELSYTWGTQLGFNASATETPISIFFRVTNGRIAPEPENDTTFLLGTRFGF